MDKEHNAEKMVGASAPSFSERETTGLRKKGLALIAKVDVRPIPVAEIGLTERIRVDDGDIEELAENISEHGLINPITVMQQESGGFMLISGYRRLKACQLLECDAVSAAVLSAVDAEERLRLEISENEQRKDFTVSEKLEYASKIRIVEEEKARQRKSRRYREEAESQPDGVVRPAHSGDITKGRARDAVAKSVGLGSGRQLERAEYLAKNRPDLLKKVDREETTIYGAYNAAKNENGALGIEISEEKKDSTEEYAAPVNAEAPVYVGPDHPEMWKRLEAYNPGFERNTGSGIKGASHIKLLENHIYATLYEKYMEAIKSVNIMVGSYEKARNGFEIKMSGMLSNLDAVIRERDELKQEKEKLKQDLIQAEKTGQTYHQERDELCKELEAYRKKNERLQQELQNTRSEGRKRK